ncbi:MAG: SDR family oxidoreductase [bacterium]
MRRAVDGRVGTPAPTGAGEGPHRKDKGDEGLVALVTGGARRLGAGISRHLAEQGFRTVVNYRGSRGPAEGLVRAIRRKGGEAVSIRADVTRPADVERMVRRTEDLYGRLDVLVNNVGEYLEKPLSGMKHEEWERVLRSNLTSVFICCMATLPLLRRSGKGRIIVIGYAPAGKMAASSRCAAYHIAKSGALILTKSLAAEEARHGVTVNMVSPGTIFNSVKKPSRDPRDYIPAGRFCRYDDIFGAIDYLLSERASYVTGGHLVVSGGYAI